VGKETRSSGVGAAATTGNCEGDKEDTIIDIMVVVPRNEVRLQDIRKELRVDDVGALVHAGNLVCVIRRMRGDDRC
jgi:hypothetical protein